MHTNIIHIQSFEGEYKTGLIFSMIEGLKSGENLKLICDQQPSELEKLLQESGLQNISWTSAKNGPKDWELMLCKEDPLDQAAVGCCGMCGGHGSEKSTY